MDVTIDERDGAADSVRADVACPRCGYDLRGTVHGWATMCPLAGSCPECGLELAWCEIIGGDPRPPAWCVERPAGWLRWPLQVVLTLQRTIWPWWFFRDVRMGQRVRLDRIAWYVLSWLVLWYLVVAVGAGAQSWLEWHRVMSVPGRTSSVPGAVVFVHTVAVPFSGRSIGQVTGPGGGRSRISPPRSFTSGQQQVMGAMVVVLVHHVVGTLVFALLPVSRRRARVRWTHIARISLYGLGVYVPFFLLGALAVALIDWGMIGGAGLMAATGLVGIATPVVALAWWSVATGRHLRIPHGWAVGLAVLIIGTLGGLVVLAGIVALLQLIGLS